MQVIWPKMKELELLEANLEYDFIQNYTDLHITAEDKNGVIWKFGEQEVRKHYRNKKGIYVTDTYYWSDLKKSNKFNSYRKFFSRLTKKLPEVLVW